MKIHIKPNMAQFVEGGQDKHFDKENISSLQPFIDHIHSLIEGNPSDYHIFRIFEGKKVISVKGSKNVVTWNQINTTLWDNLKNELLAL